MGLAADRADQEVGAPVAVDVAGRSHGVARLIVGLPDDAQVVDSAERRQQDQRRNPLAEHELGFAGAAGVDPVPGRAHQHVREPVAVEVART